MTLVYFHEPKCSPKKSDTTCSISVLDKREKQGSEVAELKNDALKTALYFFHATPLLFYLRLQLLVF